MQIDMHYYGTYAMARAAGVAKVPAQIIATAAQFVDDSAKDDASKRFNDGSWFYFQATAHHAEDLKNHQEKDQRHVWVPFHFIPGNQGDSFAERLICRKDSQVANDMINYNLSLSDRPYALELIGITAHVYADTFAHYGFSGISHPLNMIADGSTEYLNLRDEGVKSYIEQKAASFLEKYDINLPSISSMLVERGSTVLANGVIGHGAVLTNPDRPYLNWRYLTEHPNREPVERDNLPDFVEGCEKLHQLFKRLLEARPDFAEDNGIEFSSIADLVREVLSEQAPKEGRIDAWIRAVESGDLFQGPGETIPEYMGDGWIRLRDTMGGDNSQTIQKQSVYRFYQAAQAHRSNVLRDLLPANGLVVA
jgi:hypothetical protein